MNAGGAGNYDLQPDISSRFTVEKELVLTNFDTSWLLDLTTIFTTILMILTFSNKNIMERILTNNNLVFVEMSTASK